HFRELMTQPFLRLLERSDQVEDRLALLAGDDAAVGKAAPVEIALDAELDRQLVAAAAQEIGMQRMRVAIVRYGAPRGDKSLRDRLAAEDPTRPLDLTAADELVTPP